MLRDSTALLLSDFLVINMHRRCYSGKRSVEWVSRLPAVVKALNNEKTRLIGLKPKDAIKAKTVSQKVPHFSRPFGINEKKLPDGIIVCYLLAPGELEGGQRRATDPVWSLEVYRLGSTLIKPGQPVLYYLMNGLQQGFAHEELQIVPPDTQLPPDKVL